MTPRFRTLIGLAVLPLLMVPSSAGAQEMRGGNLGFKSGEATFQGVCQGCHMPDAKGAVGAGAYPALAGDKRLETAGYPVLVVTRGQKDMPAFGHYMSDQQIADVINYVRSHFGNHYTDAVTPAEIEQARPDQTAAAPKTVEHQ